MRFKIVDSDGNINSMHNTHDTAEKKHKKDLAWRCGICGLVWRGWCRCSHGSHNQVCDAHHYNDKIVQIG
jgi:hypothetical protein